MNLAVLRTDTRRASAEPAVPVAARNAATCSADYALRIGALERIGTRATITRGQTLFYEGDPADTIYKVVRGAVRISRVMADGRRYVADFLFPGDLFGISDEPYRTMTAEALCEAIVVRYPCRLFEGVVQEDRRLGRLIYGVLCGGLTSAHDRMLLLGRKSAVEKIASFLLMMAERRCADPVELPMPRADIADYLGLTLETVSRILSQLRAEGVIAMPDPVHIVLVRRTELESIADGASANM